MSQRITRPATSTSADGAERPAQRIGSSMSSSGLTQRINSPRSLAEAEEHYVSCRDAWTAAMRAASSGRPADMATLAICQEAYEAAALERERWLSGGRVAIKVEEPATDRAPIEVVVDQTLAWRDVHDHERDKPRGVLGRLFGRRKR
jgi:hypothetical protein